MKEFIDKQTGKMEEKVKVTSLEIIVTGCKTKPYFEIKYKEVGKEDYNIGYSSYDLNNVFGWKEECFEIVNQLAEEYKVSEMPTGWIPCSERLPQVETEVYIVAKRKYSGGTVRYITTTALYEDGTVRENDSCWRWEDIEGEWDEEEDCYIIPEGWWEYKHYNPDEVYNNVVDDEVIAWMPLPTPYTEGE